ncbi:MAG TPA: hypothetical protein VFQ35_15635, partial [Polyangiaceae bacterium]|nr:hypothetical protein [Polyangiaceae bacterium]
MTDASKVRAHFAALPSDAKPPAAELLAQISHDIKGPIATLAMECFSARMVLRKARQNASGEHVQTLAKQLEEISNNLERASTQLSDYLAALTTLRDADKD